MNIDCFVVIIRLLVKLCGLGCSILSCFFIIRVGSLIYSFRLSINMHEVIKPWLLISVNDVLICLFLTTIW